MSQYPFWKDQEINSLQTERHNKDKNQFDKSKRIKKELEYLAQQIRHEIKHEIKKEHALDHIKNILIILEE